MCNTTYRQIDSIQARERYEYCPEDNADHYSVHDSLAILRFTPSLLAPSVSHGRGGLYPRYICLLCPQYISSGLFAAPLCAFWAFLSPTSPKLSHGAFHLGRRPSLSVEPVHVWMGTSRAEIERVSRRQQQQTTTKTETDYNFQPTGWINAPAAFLVCHDNDWGFLCQSVRWFDRSTPYETKRADFSVRAGA